MGRILRVEIVVLATSTAIVLVRRRDLQNLDPHLLNEAKQAGAIAAGRTRSRCVGPHRRIASRRASVGSPGGSWQSFGPQNTVAFIDDGRDMQILMGVHAANDMADSIFLDPFRASWFDRASTASPDRVRGQDSHVTRWSGPSRVTGIGEAKPHRKAFPGGRRVQGKTRLVDRSAGQTTPRRLAAPAYQAVDRCESQAARELALIQ